MKCICLKVSLNDPESTEEPCLTSVAISKESYDLLQTIYLMVDFSSIEGSVQLKSGVVDAFWMESMDEHTKLSAKKVSELENKLDEENYCLETELEIEEGLEVENFAVSMCESGLYLSCEYEGENYSTVAFLDAAFFQTEEEEEESDEEVEEEMEEVEN